MPIGHFPQQILSSFQIPRSTNQSSQKVSNFKTSQLVELPLDLSHPRFLYHLNHLPKTNDGELMAPMGWQPTLRGNFGGNVHPNSSKFGARSPTHPPTRDPFPWKKKWGVTWCRSDGTHGQNTKNRMYPKIVRSLAATESWACCVRFCKPKSALLPKKCSNPEKKHPL